MLVEAHGPASADEAWQRFTTPATWSAWAPLIREVEASDDVLAVGTTGAVHGPPGVVVDFEVTAVDPVLRSWSWRVGRGPAAVTMDHHVLPALGGGCRAMLRVPGASAAVLQPYRLPAGAALRGLVREAEVSPARLIQPVFVVAGEGIREEVPSMPGIERCSISGLVEEAGEIAAAGIGAILLFGIPASKDETGSGAYDDEGIVQMAVRALKEQLPELTVITDVCLCEYTSHGHCGFVRDGEVDNDISVELLATAA